MCIPSNILPFLVLSCVNIRMGSEAPAVMTQVIRNDLVVQVEKHHLFERAEGSKNAPLPCKSYKDFLNVLCVGG